MTYSVTLLPDGFGGGSGAAPTPPFDGGVIHNPILAAAGLESAPSYGFDGQPGLGMRTPANGVLALVTQGHDALLLDGAGNLSITGDATFGGSVFLPRSTSIQSTNDATPQGSVIASPGSLWLGSGGSGLFYKQTGTSSSGWVPILGPRPPAFPLQAPGGSAAAPSYGFSIVAGTGMYANTSSLRLALAGTDILTLTSSGAAVTALAVGGTLDVTGATRISAPLNVTSNATLQALVVATTAQVQGALAIGGNATFAQGGTFGGPLTVSNALAVTGGTALSGTLTLAAGAQIINAAGDPRGRVAATPGSLYLSSDGGPGMTLLVKESGMGTAGWTLAGAGAGNVSFPLYAPPTTGPDAVQYGFDGTQAGIYSPAAEVLGLGTAGVERLRIGADGVVTLPGAAVLQSSLAVTGPTQLAALSASGSATFAGTVSAGGKATLLGGVGVSGLAALSGALTVAGTTALSGAATLTAGATFSGTADVTISAPLRLLGSISLQAGQRLIGGTGLPEGVVSAPIGSLFTASDSGVVFVKTSGTGPTGWSQVPTGDTAASFPLLAPDGSLTAPSYSFLTGGGRYGLFLDNGTSLVLATDGQAALRLSTTGTVVSGPLSVLGAISTPQGLSVGNTATLAGALNVAAAASFGSTLTVTGATTLRDALAVTGSATVGGGLTVTGVVAAASLSATGNIAAGGLSLWSAGTAGAPSAAFSAATGSGLFLDSTHSGIGVSIAGSQIGYFSANGYVSLTGGATPTAASVFISQEPGTAEHPAFSINEQAGMFLDGDFLSLAVGGQTALTMSQAAASFSSPLSVGGDLSAAGGLAVDGDAIVSGRFTASGRSNVGSLAIGLGFIGTAPPANGLLLQGQAQVAGGSAASPAYAFAQLGAPGTSTGLFYDSARAALGVSVAGTEVGYFSGGGYVPLAGGGGITLNDLTLTSSAQKHLTLVCGGDPAKVPTLATVGFVAGDGSSRKFWQWLMQSQGASGGTVSTNYKLSLGAADAQSPIRLSFDSVAGGYNIFAYDDAAQATTFTGGLFAGAVSAITVTATTSLRSAAGTASGPSVAFSPSPGTGVFYDSARTGMGVSVGGIEVGYFGSGGYVPLVGSNANFTSAPVINVDSGTPQLTAGQSGAVVNFTGSATVRLPLATAQVAGRYYTMMVGADGVAPAVQVASGSSDILHTPGGDVTDGQAYTGPAVRYAYAMVECNTAGHWTVGAQQGNWGNAAGGTTLFDLVVKSTTGNNLTLDSTAAAVAATAAIKSQTGQTNLVTFGHAAADGSGGVTEWQLTAPAASFALRNVLRGYDVFSYSDTAGTAASRIWAFGNVNVTGTQSLAIGASPTAAPTNGLSVQGASTFTGAVTFLAGTTGATPTYPIAAPTGTAAAPNYAYGFAGRTTSGLGYDTTNNVTVLYSGTSPVVNANANGCIGVAFVPLADPVCPIQINSTAADALNSPKYIAFHKGGTYAYLAGVNTYSTGGRPVGMWFRSFLAGQSVYFTTSNTANDQLNYGINIAPSGAVGVGAATSAASTLGVFGNLAVGSTVASGTAAPTNGLLVQGASTFQGAVTFQGGTVGVTATTTFPLAAPTGTTATPNIPYSFTGATTSGMGYNTTTGNVVLSQAGTPALTVAGPTVGLGGYAAVTDPNVRLIWDTPASVNRIVLMLNAGADTGASFGYNNDASGPVGLWFRARGANNGFAFTTGNGTAGAFNSALIVNGNTGVSVGTNAAPPAGGLLVQGATVARGNVGILNSAAPACALAVGGNGSAQGSAFPVQVTHPSNNGAYFSIVDAATGGIAAVYGHNTYTGDGAGAGAHISTANGKPIFFDIGTDLGLAYTKTGMNLAAVVGSYRLGIGGANLSLSTAGVFGNLAVGATVAGGTAAPTNGLLVQGASIFQGAVTFSGGLSDVTISSAANNNLTLSCNGSVTSQPTITTVGTFSAASNYQKQWQWIMKQLNTSNGVTDSVFSLSLGAASASAPIVFSFDAIFGGTTNLFNYDCTNKKLTTNGDISASGNISAAGNVVQSRTWVNTTAATVTVTAADNNKFYTNFGAGAQTYVMTGTGGAPVQGMIVTITNYTTAKMTVQGGTNSTILSPQTFSAAGGNTISTTNQGASITLMGVTSIGASGYNNWVTISQTGVWSAP